MFKTIRVIFLLCVLLVVAVQTWRTGVTSVRWKYDLTVNVYPINADGRSATKDYIQTLNTEDFKSLETFMKEQAKRYGRGSDASIKIRLGGPIDKIPPMAPVGGSAIRVAWWSLNMRWWAWRNGPTTGPAPQVKVFMLYFDPATRQRLDHSTALQKGLIGLVQLFAAPSMAEPNNVVLMHELLHTLGATDKYDLATNQPVFPQGYAQPDLEPRYPQQFAEIMGGRRPVSPTKSEQPLHLRQVLIGPETAREINWTEQAGKE